MDLRASSTRRSHATKWLAYGSAITLLAALAFVACSDAVTAPQLTAVHSPRKASEVSCWGASYDLYAYFDPYGALVIREAPSVEDWLVDPGYVSSWTTHTDDWEPYGDDGWVDHASDGACYEYPDPDPPVDCNATPWVSPPCPLPPPPPPPCVSDCGGGDTGGGGSGSGPHFIAVALTVDSTNVGPGSTITGSVIVATDDGTPYTIDGWTYTGLADTSCTPDLSCTLRVESSGMLSFSAHRNDGSSSSSDSAQITVVYPCSQTETMDARDHIRAEYDSTALFSGQPWKPDCNALVNNAVTPNSNFKHSELYIDVDGHYGYGVFVVSLLRGLESMRSIWLANTSYLGLGVTSVYRSPRVNANVYLSRGLPYVRRDGRHMHGDAADLANPEAGTSIEHTMWQKLFDLATTLPGSHVLTAAQDSSCSRTCVHLDYR